MYSFFFFFFWGGGVLTEIPVRIIAWIKAEKWGTFYRILLMIDQIRKHSRTIMECIRVYFMPQI